MFLSGFNIGRFCKLAAELSPGALDRAFFGLGNEYTPYFDRHSTVSLSQAYEHLTDPDRKGGALIPEKAIPADTRAKIDSILNSRGIKNATRQSLWDIIPEDVIRKHGLPTYKDLGYRYTNQGVVGGSHSVFQDLSAKDALNEGHTGFNERAIDPKLLKSEKAMALMQGNTPEAIAWRWRNDMPGTKDLEGLKTGSKAEQAAYDIIREEQKMQQAVFRARRKRGGVSALSDAAERAKADYETDPRATDRKKSGREKRQEMARQQSEHARRVNKSKRHLDRIRDQIQREYEDKLTNPNNPMHSLSDEEVKARNETLKRQMRESRLPVVVEDVKPTGPTPEPKPSSVHATPKPPTGSATRSAMDAVAHGGGGGAAKWLIGGGIGLTGLGALASMHALRRRSEANRNV